MRQACRVADDRNLTDREREVLLFLTAGDHDTATALREQVRYARVLKEASCCASAHVGASREDARDAPAGGLLTIEAQVRGVPERVVRLVTSSEARLSHIEISHDGEAVGPPELPPTAELDSPHWWEWHWSDAPPPGWRAVPWPPGTPAPKNVTPRPPD